MIQEEEEDENISYFDQDSDEGMEEIMFYREACKQIEKVDCQTQKGMQVLAKSYRRVKGMIGKLERDSFNTGADTEEGLDLMDSVLSYSFFCQPYPMHDPSLLFRTRMAYEYYKANRTYKPPAVLIDEQLITNTSKPIKISAEKSEFPIKIQSQPSSQIIYSNMPSHPLLTNLDDNPLLNNPKNFQNVRGNEVTDVLSPPCSVNILVVGQSKLSSKLVQLRIVQDQGETAQQTGFATYAIRPIDSFPFEDSSYQNGQSSNSKEFFMNLEDQSEQR